MCLSHVQVEDIIDSGHTLARLSKVLTAAGADSVKVVALLDKKGRRRVEFFPDYVGWEVSSCWHHPVSCSVALCHALLDQTASGLD
jgi:pyrimidine operon attenuation protein/uracil phosphoribosyltransferase